MSYYYSYKQHFEEITNQKASPIHRKSFNPIQNHLPTFAYIKRNHLINRLGKQLVACHLIRIGHEILELDDDNSQVKEIDIISRYKGELIFTNVDTIIVEYRRKNIELPADVLEENRILDFIKNYIADQALDGKFQLYMSKIYLGKGNPKIKIFNKSIVNNPIKELEENY